MVGKTLGHYEILEPLGAGGMGEVYRARDTKLDRDVAVKVLPEDFATGGARFTVKSEQEEPVQLTIGRRTVDAWRLEASSPVESVYVDGTGRASSGSTSIRSPTTGAS